MDANTETAAADLTSQLRFATARRITAVWVLAYTINEDGTAHIFSHSRDPEFADREFAAAWPQYRLIGDEDDNVAQIEITSRGGVCRWTVSNPRDQFEYDAEALVAALLAK